MGTTYTNDTALGDFIIGNATGARYNFHSSLGASCRPPVASPVIGAPRSTGHKTLPALMPSHPIGKITFGPGTNVAMPRRPIGEPSASEKLFLRLSLGPSMWFNKRCGQLVNTKAWAIVVLSSALLAAACIAALGWGDGNLWTQIVAIALGFAGGALVPYGTLLLCAGFLAAYAYLLFGLMCLGMIVAGLLVVAAALAGAGGAIYSLFVLVSGT